MLFVVLFLAFNFIAGFSSAINMDGLLARAIFFSDLPRKMSLSVLVNSPKLPGSRVPLPLVPGSMRAPQELPAGTVVPALGRQAPRTRKFLRKIEGRDVLHLPALGASAVTWQYFDGIPRVCSSFQARSSPDVLILHPRAPTRLRGVEDALWLAQRSRCCSSSEVAFPDTSEGVFSLTQAGLGPNQPMPTLWESGQPASRFRVPGVLCGCVCPVSRSRECG